MGLRHDQLVITRKSVTDIPRWRICKPGADDGSAELATAGTDVLFGVSSSTGGAAGHRVDVHMGGINEVEYGGDVLYGARLTSDGEGRAVTAQVGDSVIGIAMENGSLGVIGSVLFAPSHAN